MGLWGGKIAAGLSERLVKMLISQPLGLEHGHVRSVCLLAVPVRAMVQFIHAATGRPAVPRGAGAGMSGLPSPTPESRRYAARASHRRRLRIARGACWVITVGLTIVTGITLLDAAVTLPGWARGIALAAWVTGIGVLIWRLVVRPWREEPRHAAPHIRQELTDNLRAATAAALALAGCLLAGTFVPGAGDHLRRVAVPWHRAAVAPYRVIVTSGDSVVRRGQTITLTAYVEKTDAGAPTAREARLLIREAGTADLQVIPMIGDGNAAFHATRTTVADFEYRVESEGAVGDWYSVAVIDPAVPIAGTFTEILPPKYAPNAETVTRPGLPAIEGVQYATAEYRLRFSRPPADAYLEFRAEGSPPELLRVVLAPDRLTGAASFRLRQSGTIRLVTLTEDGNRKLRIEEPTVAVKVRPDTPPRFEQIIGLSPRPMTARPDDCLRIAVSVSDDIAIGSAMLDWLAPGDSQVNTVPISLSGKTSTTADGRIEFPLKGKAGPDQFLRFRIRVEDTRRIDELGLKPQSTTYPENDWVRVMVRAEAPSLAAQEIIGRRDVVKDAVAAARNEIRDAAENVALVVGETADRATLEPDHVARLANAREHARKAISLLNDAANEATLTPETSPLAATLRAAAETELRAADDAVRRAGPAPVMERASALSSARKLLIDVGEALEVVVSRNERLARDQLDSLALASLASELSKRAAHSGSPAELDRKLQEIRAAFSALLRESAPLKEAMDNATRTRCDRLAGVASELAGQVHAWNEAILAFHVDARNRLLAGLAADQQALTHRTVELLNRAETPARLARATFPKPDEFRKLGELIMEAKTLEALTEMEAAARALDAVAATFDRWATDRLDSKLAARHLALWQDDLRTRFRQATGGNPGGFAELPIPTQAAFRAEQAAIRETLAALRPAPGPAVLARDAALEHVTGASNFLKGAGANADVAMKIAAEQLNLLAEKLPTVPERLATSRPEFEKLFREQESILVGVEQALRGSDAAALRKKLAPFADRQRRQLAVLAVLDLPGFDNRRARVSAAFTAATADLQEGLPLDAVASQAWAKRELERIRAVLFDNAVPPDDKVAELSRRLDEALRAAQAASVSPVLAANVQDIYRQLGQVPRVAEAASLQAEALESLRIADLSFRNGTPAPDRLRKLRLAADDLARFSGRLNGEESDHDRVRRLAENRRLASSRAREIPPAAPVNAETPRELGREIEELTYTRVGAVAQVAKKRLLDEYIRLRDKPGADRMAGAHAGLAMMLDELAALMADIDELNTTLPRIGSDAAPTPGDDYLPSRLFAVMLRDIAARQRLIRGRVADLPTELRKWTRPGATDLLAELEQKQRALAVDLREAAKASPQELTPSADAATAEREIALVAEHLRNGSVRAARQAGERAAALLRKLARGEQAQTFSIAADRQEQILRELEKAADVPGIVATRRQARANELARAIDEFSRSLSAAAIDFGPDSTAGKSLSDAAIAVKAAAKLPSDAEDKYQAGKADEAATLRELAETQLRAGGAKAAGLEAGPTVATLPRVPPETISLGELLLAAESALRRARDHLGDQPDLTAAAKAMSSAAASLDRAAAAIRERATTGVKR